MGDVTPPPLQGPTSKERKYDRQLRLWAASGQAALEEAHVLLINSGPGIAGIEALKNLVLPGFGQFTILDPALVTEADLGVNFFLEDEDLGAFRAERCTKWLNELNPDVQGHHITEPFETFFARPDALLPYNLILVSQPVKYDFVKILSQHGLQFNTPVFYIHSIGFYAGFTLQLPSAFPIVDTHPDPATTQDLRLLEPWPELEQFAEEKTQGINQMDEEQHGHIPYLLILLHYLRQWKDSHNGQTPQNYRDKTAFRELVRSGTRTNNPEGGEENFDEAVGAVLKSLNPAMPSSAVREVFEAPECSNLTSKEHKVLPLSGSLPDMKAKSADYIALQTIYKTKARKDVAEVVHTVQELEKALGRQTSIDVREVETFCKSAGYVKLVRGHPYDQEPNTKAIFQALGDPTSLMPLHLAFMAYDIFAEEHSLSAAVNMAPGSSIQQPPLLNPFDDVETTINKMTSIAHAKLDEFINQSGNFLEDPEYSMVKEQLEKVITDLCNAQGGELHNISAVAGGVVAQEAIKAITKQYVPVNNVWCFDGVRSVMSAMKI